MSRGIDKFYEIDYTFIMYEQFLTQTGLTNDQAAIYEILVKQGSLPASKVAVFAGIKRGLTYKILEELEEMGLVEKHDAPGKVSKFEAAHPLRMRDLLEKKERETKDSREVLETVLPKLVSDFNLMSGKPGIQFYEGIEGARTVANDSLTSKTEIYSYIDNEAVNRVVPEINEGYIKKRAKLGLKKKMITLDTPYIREHAKSFNPALTDVRVIPATHPFATVMQIYDNKVSYVTLVEGKVIGIIIDDASIAAMHRSLFEYMWLAARPLQLKK